MVGPSRAKFSKSYQYLIKILGFVHTKTQNKTRIFIFWCWYGYMRTFIPKDR